MTHHDPRTHEVPPDLLALVRDAVARRGRNAAGRALGVHPSTLTTVLAGLPVTNGTLATLRLAQLRRQEHGSAPDMIGNMAGRIVR